MNLIFYIVIITISLVVIIDLIPKFMYFQGRIHIGRYSENSIWYKKINGIGEKWLNNTPKIKVTDNTRLIAIDMLKGNYTKSAIQNWQEAALLLGLGESI